MFKFGTCADQLNRAGENFSKYYCDKTEEIYDVVTTGSTTSDAVAQEGDDEIGVRFDAEQDPEGK